MVSSGLGEFYINQISEQCQGEDVGMKQDTRYKMQDERSREVRSKK